MPLRKFRYVTEAVDEAREMPHLAADHDDGVASDDGAASAHGAASPVHAMHAELWAFANQPTQTDDGLYPGWIRLAFPLVASGGLWLAGFWMFGYLR